MKQRPIGFESQDANSSNAFQICFMLGCWRNARAVCVSFLLCYKLFSDSLFETRRHREDGLPYLRLLFSVYNDMG